MRVFPRLLLVILSFGIALMPLSTLHAHVGSDHHESALHGGHVHAGDLGQDDHGFNSVIDLSVAVADRGAGAFSWTNWLPLIVSLAVLWLGRPYLTAILRPPPTAVQLPRTRTYFLQPPLRGPPASPINSR